MLTRIRSTVAVALALTTALLLGGCAAQSNPAATTSAGVTQSNSATTTSTDRAKSDSDGTNADTAHTATVPDDLIVLTGVTANQPIAQIPIQVAPIVQAAIAAQVPLTVIKVDGDPAVIWHSSGYQINTKNAEVEGNDINAVQSSLLSAVQGAKATVDGSNLSGALSIAGDQATADGAKHPVIISVDSGLSDSGYPNMTTPGMTTARPADVADFGKQQNELPRLPANAMVYLTGIGYGAGPQPQLTPGQRSTVSGIWEALIRKTGASVRVMPTPRVGASPKTSFTAGVVEPAAVVQFKVHKTAKGIEASLDTDVLFEPDRWNLLPSSTTALDGLVTLLTNTPGKILVEGFTDIGKTSVVGGLTALSQHRADAVKAYLVQHGIPSDRVTAEGMGKGTAKVASPSNRRVVVLTSRAAA